MLTGFCTRLLTSTGQPGSPVLEVAFDDTFASIGIHCAGHSSNFGSAIGHAGNHLDAFRQGLENANLVGYIDSKGGEVGTRVVEVPLPVP